jgi:6-phosphogluconolactonase (cycloisomerase 2 family)
MLKHEANMTKIYNTKTRVYGVGHEKFSCTTHIIAIILQEPRTFQLNSSNEQLLVSHRSSQKVSIM